MFHMLENIASGIAVSGVGYVVSLVFPSLQPLFSLGSKGTERTVVMDKSKGEPVISVKTSTASKDRVSNVSAWETLCVSFP